MSDARLRVGCLCVVAAMLAAGPPPPVHAQDPPPAVGPGPSSTAPDNARIDDVWIARFERAYGEAGLYIEEQVNPREPASRSRVSLIRLQQAVNEFHRRFPGGTVSAEALRREGLMPPLPAPMPGEKFEYDPATRQFSSSVGETVSLRESARLCLEANAALRGRMARPNTLVFSRWERLLADPDAPELIRREVRFRDVLNVVWSNRAVREAEACQHSLGVIRQAIGMYATQHKLPLGAPVTITDAASTGLMDALGQCPGKGRYAATKVGEDPTCSVGGAHALASGDAVAALRRGALEEFERRQPGDRAAALAIRARLAPTAEALRLIDEAVSLEPDLPALRVERLAHLARAGMADAMTRDLDYLLARFPAAPILAEIDAATSQGRLAVDGTARGDVAMLLADARPDVLTEQLRALAILPSVGRLADAQRIYDRLVATQPGYAALFPRPGAEPAPTPRATTQPGS